MRDRITQAFDQVHAEESLKASTRAFLRQKTRGYTRAGTPGYLRMIPAAACLVLVILAGRWLYFTPTVEISIDINPSLELGINRFDRVISTTGYNDDGQALLDSLDLNNLEYNQAVELILSSDTVASLLSGDAVLTIGVIGPDGEQTTRVLSDMEDCTSHSENMHCFHAYEDTSEDAHELGLSCGKYRAYLQLKALDPSVTPEAVADMTMQEIWDRINALSTATGESAQPQTSTEDAPGNAGQGNGNGAGGMYYGEQEHHDGEHWGEGSHHGWDD